MMTTKEVADAAGLRLDQVYWMMRNRQIPEPAQRFGKSFAWTMEEADALVALVGSRKGGGDSEAASP